MKAYLAELRARADELRAEKPCKHHSADTRVVCNTPLANQIEALMRSLPPAQRDRPWPMDEFIARLQGRYSARPHPMNVGQALGR